MSSGSRTLTPDNVTDRPTDPVLMSTGVIEGPSPESLWSQTRFGFRRLNAHPETSVSTFAETDNVFHEVGGRVAAVGFFEAMSGGFFASAFTVVFTDGVGSGVRLVGSDLFVGSVDFAETKPIEAPTTDGERDAKTKADIAPQNTAVVLNARLAERWLRPLRRNPFAVGVEVFLCNKRTGLTIGRVSHE
jgi:hypothetical protein